ncbi:MAG TPA: hypothetical protein VMV18_13565 [bacterium]|nr:hypothetical protein [bacterium]
MRRPTLAAALSALALTIAFAVPRFARADDNDDIEKDINDLAAQQKTAEGGKASAADLEAMAKKILGTMSEIRKLPIKHSVTMEVATREQIVGYVDSRMKEEMKPNELDGQEAALKRLGLVPEKLDMKKFMLDLYGEQVAGYYDPFKQKFFIASWMAPMMQAPIMAHELTHALQDQSFNLKPFLTPIPDNSDATSARQAVVEGDAVIAMFKYLGHQSGMDITPPSVGEMIRNSMASPAYPTFMGAPAYFKESLYFPYADGADFIQKTLAANKGDWASISALYAHLPKSSEQVLHPEKYLKDDPKPVDLAIKIPGWKEVHTDVLGELVLRTLLAGFLTDDQARDAAEGWGGDRYRAFQREKGPKTVAGTMVVLRTTWDTEKDAKEFEAAYLALLPKKYDGARSKSDDHGTTFTTIEDGLARVERSGSDVLIVDGAPDPDTLTKTTALAWPKK